MGRRDGTVAVSLVPRHRHTATHRPARTGSGTGRRCRSFQRSSCSYWSRIMHESLAIETAGLVKTFGTTRAVDGIDLAVPAGTVYGVLGPNGAGKTTTIRILATLLRPDKGTARVFGHDVAREADAVRGRISLTGQYASVDEDLTGTENLVLLSRLRGYSW